MAAPVLPDLSGKTVVVVGLGHSGVAAVRLASRAGARVRGVDSRTSAELPDAARSLAAELLLGEHTIEHFDGADLVVVSPGVPPLAVLDEVAARPHVEVIGELEFASRAIAAPILAIGGTNGKSTTTTLITRMLEATGDRVFAGGNLGEPAALATESDYDWVVFEVSSFQLERAPTFRPHVSVLLNVSEDHLDRYPDYATYVQAKGNAFVNMAPSDIAIVPDGDAACIEQARRGRAQLVTFGGGGYTVRGTDLVESSSGNSFSLEGLPLHGRHNWDNLAAGVAAVRAIGVEWAVLQAGLAKFVPLAHRMQRVRRLGGVNYYDDSKGTNVGASVTAVMGLTEPRCVLIAGGRDKHGSYEPLIAALWERGRALVVLGEAAPRLVEAAGVALPVVAVDSMADAVAQARVLARPGDAVLLSPACSSFDMFSGYAERGRAYAQAVNSLAEAPSA